MYEAFLASHSCAFGYSIEHFIEANHVGQAIRSGKGFGLDDVKVPCVNLTILSSDDILILEIVLRNETNTQEDFKLLNRIYDEVPMYCSKELEPIFK